MENTENEDETPENPGNYISDEEQDESMVTKRRKIKGKYFSIRQKTTAKGSKGTIKGKWKPEKAKSRNLTIPMETFSLINI